MGTVAFVIVSRNTPLIFYHPISFQYQTRLKVHLLSLLTSLVFVIRVSRCLLVSCQMTLKRLLRLPVCCDVIDSGYDVTSGWEAASRSAASSAVRRQAAREADMKEATSAGEVALTSTEETQS